LFEQNINHTTLQLDEKEATQLARAVQTLVRELGFDPEEVDRSYGDSLAYFLKNDPIEPGTRDASIMAVQMSTNR
jgi:hypothetical protein